MNREHVMTQLDFEKKAFYTPGEISSLLHVHPSTVRDWIRTGRLFACHLSERVYRVPLGSLMEILGEHEEVVRRDLSPVEADRIWGEISNEHRTAAARHA
jgi:hypothetical protein